MSHLDELLSVYLDGETTPAESKRVAFHLDDCLRCRRRLEDLHRARAAVRSLPLLEAPAGLIPAASEPSHRRRPLWVGAAAAAAALLITVATVATPRPEPIDLSDLSRQVGARAALDSGAGSIKVVIPSAETE